MTLYYIPVGGGGRRLSPLVVVELRARGLEGVE
jgi:hypothetical protein